jgi:hypothetical protein
LILLKIKHLSNDSTSLLRLSPSWLSFLQGTFFTILFPLVASASPPSLRHPALTIGAWGKVPFKVRTPWDTLIEKREEITFFVDSKACSEHLEKLNSDVTAYASNFRYNRHLRADDALKRIKAKLSGPADHPLITPNCHRLAHQLYPYFAMNAGYTDEGNRFLALLTLKLIIRDKIQTLDGPTRTTFGPLFTTRSNRLSPENEDSSFRVLGAYDCRESKIYVDTRLRPYDLGATLIHELQHLLFDKITYWNNASHFSDSEIENTLNLEESLAVFTSSFAQYSQKAFAEKKPERWVVMNNGKGKTETGKMRHIFQADTDLTFFSKKSILKRIYDLEWEHYKTYSIYPDILSLSRFHKEATQLQTSKKTFLHSSNLESNRDIKKKFPALSAIQQLFGKVTDLYFSHSSEVNSTLSRGTFELFSQRILSSPAELFPGVSSIFSSLEPTSGGYSDLRSILPPGVFERLRMKSGAFFRLYEDRDLNERMDTPSLGCEQFQESLRNGRLDHYLGRIERPGGDGVKPSGPIKPGGDGVKPDLFGIRPCVHLEEAGGL